MNLQADGNLVIYDTHNNAMWATHTWNSENAFNYLQFQDDGNLVLRTVKDGSLVW